MTSLVRYIAALSSSAGLIIFAIAPLDGLDLVSSRLLGLAVIVVSLWVTGIVSPALPAIILFLVVMLFGLSSPSVTFSGFSAGAAWLTFTGIIFGLAIHRTGLGDRLAIYAKFAVLVIVLLVRIEVPREFHQLLMLRSMVDFSHHHVVHLRGGPTGASDDGGLPFCPLE